MGRAADGRVHGGQEVVDDVVVQGAEEMLDLTRFALHEVVRNHLDGNCQAGTDT
jgi:hypothetical protein